MHFVCVCVGGDALYLSVVFKFFFFFVFFCCCFSGGGGGEEVTDANIIVI